MSSRFPDKHSRTYEGARFRGHAWFGEHERLFDVLLAAGIDTSDLAGWCPFGDACIRINDRLRGAGCEDLPEFGESLERAIVKIEKWAASRTC